MLLELRGKANRDVTVELKCLDQGKITVLIVKVKSDTSKARCETIKVSHIDREHGAKGTVRTLIRRVRVKAGFGN